MKNFVVDVLYQDCCNETQQEIFEVTAVSKSVAEKHVRALLAEEGATITYLKIS